MVFRKNMPAWILAANSVSNIMWFMVRDEMPLSETNTYHLERYDQKESYSVSGKYSTDATCWDPVRECVLLVPSRCVSLVERIREPFILWYYKQGRKIEIKIDEREIDRKIKNTKWKM